MNKTTKIIALVVVCLLLGTLGGYGGLVYWIKGLEQQVESSRIQIARGSAHEQELASLAKLVEKTAEERAELSSYIITNTEFIHFLDLLNKLGKEQGAEINTMPVDPVPTDGQFEEIEMQITVSASYAVTEKVLTMFESLPYRSYVTKASVTRGAEKTVPATWDSQFTLIITQHSDL